MRGCIEYPNVTFFFDNRNYPLVCSQQAYYRFIAFPKLLFCLKNGLK